MKMKFKKLVIQLINIINRYKKKKIIVIIIWFEQKKTCLEK